jgi:hypothetical protein
MYGIAHQSANETILSENWRLNANDVINVKNTCDQVAVDPRA